MDAESVRSTGPERSRPPSAPQSGARPLGTRSLELLATPLASPRARRALAEMLEDSPLEPRGDDAALALSELVSNAVLHGRERLQVRLTVTDHALRAEVEDGSPLSPSFSSLGPTAVTGRGLLLVATCSDRWGVEPAEDGKVVWFEVDATPPGTEDVDVDALLAAWAGDLEDPADEVVRVVLTDLDVGLTARAEAHGEALLRELALLAAGGDEATGGPSGGQSARTAERVLQAAAPVEGLRAEMRRQVAVAVAEGRPSVDVVLSITRVDGDVVRAFAQAMDDADRLSRTGRLLTEPAPRELSDARSRYLHRVLAQLSS